MALIAAGIPWAANAGMVAVWLVLLILAIRANRGNNSTHWY